jgi:D-glycero-D-manno-heptose 1,7-bisphosphate phosphatase
MVLAQPPPHALGNPRRELLPQAVFLDRDGTVNVERADYVKSVEELVFLAGALDAISDLSRFEIPIVLITNQSAIGRGIVAPEQIDSIHAHLRAHVRAAGGRIDAIYTCPHRPDEECACRKPKPGLLLDAAADLHLDLRQCVFIGDSVSDLNAARAAGCQPIMVCTGRQAQALAQLAEVDHSLVLVADLSAAVEWMHRRLFAGLHVCDVAPISDAAAASHRG